MPEVVPFAAHHLDGILGLCRAEGWPSLPADRARAQGVLSAPNAVTLVAVEDGAVIGFAAAISDGAIEAYLSTLVVAASHRRRGVGTALITAAFRVIGVERLNLLAEPGVEPFYESMPHRTLPGYRLYADPEP